MHRLKSGERCASQAYESSDGSLVRKQVPVMLPTTVETNLLLRKRVEDVTKRFATTIGVDIVLVF